MISIIWFYAFFFIWHTPKLLDGFNYKSKGEDSGRRGVGAHFLAHITLGVEGSARVSRWDYEDWQAIQSLTQTCTN
jgi:hypothetical protein